MSVIFGENCVVIGGVKVSSVSVGDSSFRQASQDDKEHSEVSTVAPDGTHL
jgi:hypothetical protein